ncbi:hypothetical protein CEXT_195141 [Caerostris extrusa]|uniref:Uncharacterized protein n=1 Tax=Caerostris extrusa TaxID=172846 RepID=A0AAV4M884_CAEEX|nr:hypothetical protein CEXT_195141 [Caerostris extrusa]
MGKGTWENPRLPLHSNQKTRRLGRIVGTSSPSRDLDCCLPCLQTFLFKFSKIAHTLSFPPPSQPLSGGKTILKQEGSSMQKRSFLSPGCTLECPGGREALNSAVAATRGKFFRSPPG